MIANLYSYKPGQKMLEVSCSPGFFTIPAAKIMEKKKGVYARC